MKKLILVGLGIATCLQLSSQSFAEWVYDLMDKPENARQEIVDQYLTTQETFPLAEDTLVHFIYSGPLTELAIAGDFSGWNPGHENAPMANIPGTNLWYRTYTFDSKARLEYKMVANGDNWFSDPLNPRIAPGDYSNSELIMPDYEPPTEVWYVGSIPHGNLSMVSFESTYLQNERRISVYLPAGYSKERQGYPMVLVNDGLEYATIGNMVQVLDQLIADQVIEPLIAIFVPPVNRTEEYAEEQQDPYTLFLVEELMPWAEERYHLQFAPSARAIIGSSYGGNISLWVAMKHPYVFGKVGAFSSFIEEDIQVQFSEGELLDLKIYLNHGIYDHLDPIHESLNDFLPILEARQYDFLYEEYPEGHSYGFWRAHLDDTLKYLFPGLEIGE